MKRLTFSIFATFLVTGCLEYTPMYKVGATTQETNVTRAQCNTYAANTVPVMLITDWIPIYGADGRIIGHRTEVYDANEGRRYSEQQRCMEREGFARVSIPYCKDEDLAGRSFKPLTTSPPITDSICAIRQQGGGRVIVDLNKPAG